MKVQLPCHCGAALALAQQQQHPLPQDISLNLENRMRSQGTARLQDIDRDGHINDILATNPSAQTQSTSFVTPATRIPAARLGYATSKSATAAMQSSATMKIRDSGRRGRTRCSMRWGRREDG